MHEAARRLAAGVTEGTSDVPPAHAVGRHRVDVAVKPLARPDQRARRGIQLRAWSGEWPHRRELSTEEQTLAAERGASDWPAGDNGQVNALKLRRVRRGSKRGQKTEAEGRQGEESANVHGTKNGRLARRLRARIRLPADGQAWDALDVAQLRERIG